MMHEVLTYRAFQLVELRGDKRMAVPSFQVQLEGQPAQTINWSLGGLYLRDYPGTLEVGQTVEGVIVGSSRNGMEQMPFTAVVVRVEPDGGIGLRFDGVEGSQVDFFERCLLRYMSPKSGDKR